MAQIYKATYSGVPVYEFMCKNVAVMKRRSDSYLNATQILKVAEFDKPQRTRILEREVQTGEHEKVQGGYGKYQGTWVPFERGVALAEHYKVDSLLRPIFDFVKGDQSPPLAPKHSTLASTRPRKPRSTTPKRKKLLTKHLTTNESLLLDSNLHFNHELDNTPFNLIANDRSFNESGEMNNINHSRRKRARPLIEAFNLEEELLIDNQENNDTLDRPERSYAQQLLQYFISDDTGIPAILLRPPMDLDVNVIIDDEGHTSLHWAAAMGRLKLVSLLINLGADIYRVNYKGQTALMRSVLFTNNFDAKSFIYLIGMLKKTIFNIDKKDQTVFHHVAATASWKGKVHASRYYMECLIETLSSDHTELVSILNVQDVYGDTALSIAAKIGNKKLVKLLIDAGASTEIMNEEGMTAREYINEIEKGSSSHINRYCPIQLNRFSSHHIDTIGNETNVNNNTMRHNNRHELITRTKLRHKVEGLFKEILSNNNNNNLDSQYHQHSPHLSMESQLFNSFTENYERELIQKELLIKEKRQDLELVKKRLVGTQHTFEQIQYDPSKLEVIEQGSERLSKLLKRQTLKIQKESINNLISEFKKENQNPESDPTVLLERLKQLQENRKRNTEQLIQLKLRTPSKRHQEYKRLISMCCNVSYENVDLMLLPLLLSFDELEASNSSTLATASAIPSPLLLSPQVQAEIPLSISHPSPSVPSSSNSVHSSSI
ncbi:uncharacterized protein BX663DRAFT_526525 [Cokeromyces recurvatus]|uniref:uncharacterized protein n=1 Tax=Cokeromyces recurvatus TaxID=90255 RepID=UPI00221E830E|nr:uncharacterized protein BX663DRAFT_526525 [Cokeromyces recurvatus]KAI7897938.1 hypothetical protein BX663DRAFT_526525 [Cokeromyces recurvatus]